MLTECRVSFNVLWKETESKVNGTRRSRCERQQSPSKATALHWLNGPVGLRVRSTTSFDVSDARGYKVDILPTWIAGSYQLQLIALSFQRENLFVTDYTPPPLSGAAYSVLQPGTRPQRLARLQGGRGRTFGLNYFPLFWRPGMLYNKNLCCKQHASPTQVACIVCPQQCLYIQP